MSGEKEAIFRAIDDELQKEDSEATLSGTEDVEGDLLSFVGQVRVKVVSQYYTPSVHITIICPYFIYLYRSCTYEIKESNLRPRNLSLLPLQLGEILSRSFLCLISDGI